MRVRRYSYSECFSRPSRSSDDCAGYVITTSATSDLEIEYAEKLTLEPSAIADADIEALAAAGWDDTGIRELTRLAAFYNFTGRLEAASGLPRDLPDAHGIDRFVRTMGSRSG